MSTNAQSAYLIIFQYGQCQSTVCNNFIVEKWTSVGTIAPLHLPLIKSIVQVYVLFLPNGAESPCPNVEYTPDYSQY